MNMARLIDADEAKANIITFATECGSTVLPIGAILMILNQIDTVDAVAVVRCRDCKFGDWDSEPDDAMVCMRTKDGFWRSGNDFCSYGERKEG